MVLDTSVLISILTGDAEHQRLLKKMTQASLVVVGTPSMVETAMVLNARSSHDARLMLLGLLRRLNARIVPFTEDHFDSAVTAFLRFGKGRHPAALNFGDCMSYAVAAVSGLPLLYIGTEFAKTDISAA